MAKINKESLHVEYPHTLQECEQAAWQEISREIYYDMLGALPPIRSDQFTFAMGEPVSYLSDLREQCYYCFTIVEGRYFGNKPYPLSLFDSDKFSKEIFAQFDITCKKR